MSFRKRIRDSAIELLIAVILVTAYVVYLFKAPKQNRPNWDLFGFTVNTAIVFGYLVSWFRSEWKSVKYWTVFGLLLLCHIAVYIFVLRRIEQVPLVFYVLTNAGELVLFSLILQELAGDSEQPAKS